MSTKTVKNESAKIESTSLEFADPKVEALELSKSAKKAETPDGRLASTYQALKALLDAGEKIEGIEFEFWKGSKNAADFSGVTVRFVDGNPKGLDKAILSNCTAAIKKCGLSLNTMTIRKTGSFCMWGK